MLEWLTAGERGDWKVEHATLTKDQAMIENIAIGFRAVSRWIKPGTYTRLSCKGRGVVMSDTPAEISDLIWLRMTVEKGHIVRIHGLGLGIAAKLAIDQGASRVDVVEIDRDVIDLIGSQMMERFGDRLTIIHGDALKIKAAKGEYYDVVWHDIWDDINLDNWPEYKLLMRKWGRHTQYQHAWARDYLTEMLRRDRYF